ncbi:MAG: hypothetical protein JNK23_10590 [Opitutaceae bacterium]|nr:hypothetical protein [Opitutaceae bacterium]
MPIHTRAFGFTGLFFAVQRSCKAFLRAAKSPSAGRTGLINEAPPAESEGLLGLSNELAALDGDGWAVIRYGEWPNDRGLQRFGPAEAAQMVGYFKNTWQRIKRAFVGMPILRGHPDFADTLRRERDRAKLPAERSRLDALVNETERRYPDKTVYGTIADMEARAEGLAIKPVLTEAGAALVNEQGLKFFSPHWLATDLPPQDGRSVKAPVFMVSIGLTDRPNIAGTSLVNSKTTEPMKLPEWLLQLLGLANEATDDQIRATVSGLLARPESTALVNEQSARTTAESQLAEAKNKLSAAETALVNERAALATARTERNTALVNAAVQAGRITEATKPTWLARLDRDFATESTALANEQGALKTKSRTGDIGDRKPAAEAGAQFTALVNEALPKHGGDWTAAWAAVKATPEGKALHAKMESTSAT